MRWLLILPLVLLVVLFALSNTEPVRLTIWPLDVAWEAPASLAVLGFGAAAFLLGAGVAWLAAFPYRRRVRELQQQARIIQAELDATRTRAMPPAA
jgi:lipopolysaccharide assembly protein A